MREILFRGQNSFSFNWITGHYHQNPEDGHFITDFEYVSVSGNMDEPPSGYFTKNVNQVIPESVGQFTGLTDKNGKKLYEGDIVTIVDNTGARQLYIFEWRQDMYQVIGVGGPGEWLCLEEFEDCEFIGTIHDNPELLK